LPVIIGYVLYLTLHCLLRTAFMDPGIIPRAEKEEGESLETGNHDLSTPAGYLPPPRAREVQVCSSS
jgi:hypothetical protein